MSIEYEQKDKLLFTCLKERKAIAKINECMQLCKTPLYEKIWNLFSNNVFLSIVCMARNKVLVDAAALQFTTKNFYLGQNQLHFLF